MFYEDQHKLAAYLDRHPDAEWEFANAIRKGIWHTGVTYDPYAFIQEGTPIRPVLRYGLPSHLQSEIHNPDSLTEAQICEGGKYRAVLKSECDDTVRIGVMYWSAGNQKWGFATQKSSLMTPLNNLRLPATVPWPDWEQEEATQPDPKDARIAELEKANSKLSIWKDDMTTEYKKLERWFKEAGADVKRLEAQLATSPWRRMSEVPTEEDFEGGDGYIVIRLGSGSLQWLHQRNYINPPFSAHLVAWMPVPKFPGWPDPLADLLKAHGVEVTPEILAALKAWKGVEK